MASIHVLEAVGPNVYRIIVHAPTPAGNNSAGVSWAAALMAARTSVVDGAQTVQGSVMVEGTGPGQISTAENNQIKAGAIIEAEFQFGDDPSMSAAQRNAKLDAEAAKLISETLQKYSAQLKYYGASRST